MRAIDYFRLGAASVRSRKKSTANTVLGIVFGLTLLIPVLFFTIAFHADLNEKVNRTHAMSTVWLPFSAETMTADERYFALDDGLLEPVAARGSTQSIVRSQLFAFPAETGFSLVHEGKSYGTSALSALPLRNGAIPFFTPAIKAVDPRDDLVPEGTLSDMDVSSVLIAGTSFQDAKGEVLLSEPLARALGYADPAGIVGKTVSVFAASAVRNTGTSEGYYLDGDSDPDNAYTAAYTRYLSADVMRDFKVVGVISEEYYLLNSLTYQDAHIWISGAAVYREDGSSYLPAIRRHPSYPEMVVLTYPEGVDALAERAAEEKMFFPALPAVRFSRYGAREDFGLRHAAPVTVAAIECRDFNAASDLIGQFESECRAALGEEGGIALTLATGTDTGMVLVGFLNLRILNLLAGYIVLIMIAFGGVILLATLLNLFNSVNYSVQMRKNYMGMMQAIGARKSVIPKLYFVEILLIFLIALPFAFVLSGGIAYAMKLGVDAFFASNTGQTAANLFTVAITLDMGWLVAAIGITLLFTAIVALSFAFLACRTITQKSAVEVLAAEQ